MSCRYYEECPSRSNWCMGIDSGPFENCVEFLIKDYQNLKNISSCSIRFLAVMAVTIVGSRIVHTIMRTKKNGKITQTRNGR